MRRFPCRQFFLAVAEWAQRQPRTRSRVQSRAWRTAGEAHAVAVAYIDSLDLADATKRGHLGAIDIVLGGQLAPAGPNDVRIGHLERIAAQLSEERSAASHYPAYATTVLVDSGRFPHLYSSAPPDFVLLDGQPIPNTISPALLDATEDLLARYFSGADERSVDDLRLAIEYFLGGPVPPRSLAQLDPSNLPKRADNELAPKVWARYALAMNGYLTDVAGRDPDAVPLVVAWLEDGAPSLFQAMLSPRFAVNPALVRAHEFLQNNDLGSTRERITALRAVLGGDGAPWDLSDIRLPFHLGRIPHIGRHHEDEEARLAEDIPEQMAESDVYSDEMSDLHSDRPPVNVVREDRAVPYDASRDRVRRHLHLTFRSPVLRAAERVVDDMGLDREERRSYLVGLRLALGGDHRAWNLEHVRMADVESALLADPAARPAMMPFYRRVEEVLQLMADAHPDRMQNLYSEQPPELVVLRGKCVAYVDSDPPERAQVYVKRRLTPALAKVYAVIDSMDLGPRTEQKYQKLRRKYQHAVDKVLLGEGAPWDVSDLRESHLDRVELNTDASRAMQAENRSRARTVMRLMKERHDDEMREYESRSPATRVIRRGRPFPPEGPGENGRRRLNPPDGGTPARRHSRGPAPRGPRPDRPGPKKPISPTSVPMAPAVGPAPERPAENAMSKSTSTAVSAQPQQAVTSPIQLQQAVTSAAETGPTATRWQELLAARRRAAEPVSADGPRRQRPEPGRGGERGNSTGQAATGTSAVGAEPRFQVGQSWLRQRERGTLKAHGWWKGVRSEARCRNRQRLRNIVRGRLRRKPCRYCKFPGAGRRHLRRGRARQAER